MLPEGPFVEIDLRARLLPEGPFVDLRARLLPEGPFVEIDLRARLLPEVPFVLPARRARVFHQSDKSNVSLPLPSFLSSNDLMSQSEPSTA